MLLVTLATKSNALLKLTHHLPSLKISERKINDFSKKIINTDHMVDKKKIMSFEEYSSERHGSLQDFIKRMKPAFPDSTDEMLKKAYENSCKVGYRTYKRGCENPGNNIGLMLQSDFFEDKDSK